jgi:predicted nucleic acid-binding protein
MTVVSNSTPLIFLAAIGKFDLLQALFGRIHIPMAVFDEVVTQGAGRWGATETSAAKWIDCHTVADVAEVARLQAQLHGGESEVIVLAAEIQADLVIVDESAARRELKQRGMVHTGTVGVLMLAKSAGLIPALKPELDQLRAHGFRLSDRVARACLAAVGE